MLALSLRAWIDIFASISTPLVGALTINSSAFEQPQLTQDRRGWPAGLGFQDEFAQKHPELEISSVMG